MIDELHEKILCFLEADMNEDLPNMLKSMCANRTHEDRDRPPG